ncbi:MAG: ribosome-binding factor A, partial [Oligoflexus sp.]
MGLRKERMADEIRDILARNFQGGELNDPRLASVTITAVKLSADLQQAMVYFRTYSD